jgi:flagellum-specific peptidoglycan hydrolase FlgJ
MTKQEYINKFADAFVQSTIGTPLFPSVMLAQALLEGNAGKSVLAMKYHNHFGIKAGTSWKGATWYVKTSEQTKTGVQYSMKDHFRVYPSLDAGIRDRNTFLNAPRYKRVLEAKTPEMQCQALRDCGYATDVLYPQKLVNIINSYNLKQYDQKKKI